MLLTNRPVEFLGDALAALRVFPADARRSAGHQTDRVQRGLEPDDWKPMPTVGAGVREIRVHEATGAFRVIYLARFAEVVFVLHCFQKKGRRTARPDLDLAKARYRQLRSERRG